MTEFKKKAIFNKKTSKIWRDIESSQKHFSTSTIFFYNNYIFQKWAIEFLQKVFFSNIGSGLNILKIFFKLYQYIQFSKNMLCSIFVLQEYIWFSKNVFSSSYQNFQNCIFFNWRRDMLFWKSSFIFVRHLIYNKKL